LSSYTKGLSDFPLNMPLIHTIIFGVYYSALTLLVLYGGHRLHLAIGLFRRGEEAPAEVPDELPLVTLQLPMFNERHVAERLLRASAKIQYPKDRLQIQVLDDSTDDTTVIVDRVVDELQRAGHNIVAVRRPERTGYKAGALEYGLTEATGEFVAIFDADFVPEPGIRQSEWCRPAGDT
jgi:cellulose synthase/poly-beta-1,6-N-acetylglucosamine synthase-like glycosyltransferase